MVNFFIGGTFTTEVRIYAKLAFVNYLCSLREVWTSRFWVFYNLMQIDGLIWLKNSAGMFTNLFGSMTSRYCFGKSQFRFMKKTFPQRIISCTTNNIVLIKFHILIWVSNSHSELFFFQFCDEVVEVLPFMLSKCKNLWRSVVMFLLGLQYSENFSNKDVSLISSPGLWVLKCL